MKEKGKYNFSFAGCGFLGIYHVGVTTCLKKYAPHLLVDKVSGASAGALAALLLTADIPFDASLEVLLKVANTARSKTLGPFSPSFNLGKLLADVLERILPEDVHLRVNGKLHISMTRIHDRKNVIVSNFHSRQEVKDAILCATFIPFFSGLVPPSFRGIRYMDGGFTDNCPLVDEYTVTVSPYAGESDICPSDGQLSSNVFVISNTSFEISAKNIYRLTGTFFPPTPAMFYEICQQGFDDALRFLAIRDLIGCASCVSPAPPEAQSPPPRHLNSQLWDMTTKNFDRIVAEASSCHHCHLQKMSAREDTLPAPVRKVLQEDIDSGNRGLVNWLYSYKGVKILSVMALPWALSADLVIASGQKLIDTAPALWNPPLRFRPSGSGIPFLDERGFQATRYLRENFFSKRQVQTRDVAEPVYIRDETKESKFREEVVPGLDVIQIVEEYQHGLLESRGDVVGYMDTSDGSRYHALEMPPLETEQTAFENFLHSNSAPDTIVSFYND